MKSPDDPAAQIRCEPDCLFLWTGFFHGAHDGYDEGGEAVQHGDPDWQLGNLTIDVTRGQTLARQLDAAYPRFHAALPVIAAPSSPDCPAEAS